MDGRFNSLLIVSGFQRENENELEEISPVVKIGLSPNLSRFLEFKKESLFRGFEE